MRAAKVPLANLCGSSDFWSFTMKLLVPIRADVQMWYRSACDLRVSEQLSNSHVYTDTTTYSIFVTFGVP